jgi:hypothetical protein
VLLLGPQPNAAVTTHGEAGRCGFTDRGLLQAAIPLLRRDNPTDGLKAAKKAKTKGFHMWTDEEISQYRDHWVLGTQQRLAFEIGLEGLTRRCKIVQRYVANGQAGLHHPWDHG